jgi:hypothetical protein
LAIGNLNKGGILITPSRNLQMHGALTAAFTSKKKMDDDHKKFIPQLANDTKFFQGAFANPCTL